MKHKDCPLYGGKLALCIGLSLALCTQVFAGSNGWAYDPKNHNDEKITVNAAHTKVVNHNFYKRLPQGYVDDITSDQDVDKFKLTAVQKHQALVWGLSKGEEQRYVALMKNQSGFFFGKPHHFSPVEVLGMNARSNKERKKYAAMDAQMNFRTLAKEFAFYSTFQDASIALKNKLKLPVLLPSDISRFNPRNYKAIDYKQGDVLDLYTTIDKEVTPIIDDVVEELTNAPKMKIKLNVHFILEPKEDADVLQTHIQTWANDYNIPHKLVNNGSVTLSVMTRQHYKAMVQSNHQLFYKQLPLLMLHNDLNYQAIKQIQTWRF